MCELAEILDLSIVLTLSTSLLVRCHSHISLARFILQHLVPAFLMFAGVELKASQQCSCKTWRYHKSSTHSMGQCNNIHHVRS